MPKKRARSTAAPDDWSVGLSILEASAIRAASQRNYARTLMMFTQFCHFLGLTCTDAESLDATVITFMTAMFLDGEGVHSGEVEERFVEWLAKSVSAKGLPLSVPLVPPPKTRKRRPS